jgi:hypothetical protein
MDGVGGEAKSVAVGGDRIVLEDGPEICSSESSRECSDHGEELSDMYTPGFATLEEARMVTEQAESLRNRGRAGHHCALQGMATPGV